MARWVVHHSPVPGDLGVETSLPKAGGAELPPTLCRAAGAGSRQLAGVTGRSVLRFHDCPFELRKAKIKFSRPISQFYLL